MLPTNISLHPAVPADALTLAKLHNAAFENDDLLVTMYGPLTQDDPPFATDLEKIIRDDPHAQTIKAIDDETGQVVGWSLWDFYPDAEAQAKADEEARKRSSTPPATSLCPQVYLDYQHLKAKIRAKWIGGRAAAILQVLVVHPDYQGRGIGTRLLAVGVEEVRRLKLPAWLEASPAGYSVYRKCGFRDAELMELDFDKYGLTGMIQVYCMLMDEVEKS
ncbi:hypothetical protein Asppvi_009908 [Aspergillus pseudoviridinutans]|uniref:N-acetyltransferase domain-containing protein n=1 Tax=Aspergillus pseudoviridinutans TaxID=1517512 RepID=A0A9P3BL41_9EURO|nr:uncharacterized protein Asppvi_009908 [Aspergillus pseudoviridinutans]GIJ90943.1 hypothetical protein Asppvi_009908 [Aspergillus pseudoviridinutans]